MRFEITQQRGRETISVLMMDEKAAAHAIENWQSRFTDRPRTKYGMKITLDYVCRLALRETGRFVQPYTGDAKETFIIQRLV